MYSLSSDEAWKVSEAFLSTLYSCEVYERWVEVKRQMNFTSEKEFVIWLLDCVENLQIQGQEGEEYSQNIGCETDNRPLVDPIFEQQNVEHIKPEYSASEDTYLDKPSNQSKKRRQPQNEQVYHTLCKKTFQPSKPLSLEQSSNVVPVYENKMVKSEPETVTLESSDNEGLPTETELGFSGSNMGDTTDAEDATEYNTYFTEHANTSEPGIQYGCEGDTMQQVHSKGPLSFNSSSSLKSSSQQILTCDDGSQLEADKCSSHTFSDNMTSRAWKHKRNKNISCMYCSYLCVTKQELKKHLTYKHGYESNYQCSYCGKYFYDQSKLNKHSFSCMQKRQQLEAPP